MRPWIAYTLLRVGLFAAFFAVLFAAGPASGGSPPSSPPRSGSAWRTSSSGRLRERVAGDLAAARANTDKRPDEVVEDAD